MPKRSPEELQAIREAKAKRFFLSFVQQSTLDKLMRELKTHPFMIASESSNISQISQCRAWRKG